MVRSYDTPCFQEATLLGGVAYPRAAPIKSLAP
jgi:hypothetical protein